MNFLNHFWRGSSAAEYCHEGEVCLAHGEYDQAIDDFSEAIRLDPHNSVAFLDRGLAYEEEGQYQEAISDFDVAIRLDPRSATAYFNRGNGYLALEDVHRAIQDYSAALQLDPNLALASYYRALAGAEKG